MALPPELAKRFEDPHTRNEAMLDLARFYIAEPGVHIVELVNLAYKIPCLNHYPPSGVEYLYAQVRMANGLLPQANYVFASTASLLALPEKKEEHPSSETALRVCHMCLRLAEEHAAALNLPTRETLAAFARIGVQMAIYFLLKEGEPEKKSIIKSHLIYFSLIEMLALGIKTGAFQYINTRPDQHKPEFFLRADEIIPVMALLPGEDERSFKGSIVLGKTKLDHLVVLEEGKEYFYVDLGLADSDGGLE